MSKKLCFNFALSFFLFFVLLTGTIAAQKNSCAVETEIFLGDSSTSINGAAVTAIHVQTEKVYKSTSKRGQPFFANLPAGDYILIASKRGYKKTIDDREMECAGTEDSWSIDLWEGNEREIVKMFSRRKLSIKTIQGESAGTGEPTSPSQTPKTVSGGVLNSKASNLAKPAYPAAAIAVRASGAVNVQVTIDEEGNVISASAVSGHPLLRGAAEKAARESKFNHTTLSGVPVKVTGIIIYNFVLPKAKEENQ